MLLAGCMPPYIEQPLMVRVETSFLTIKWDPPHQTISHSPYYPDKYIVYYADFGTSNWIRLGEIDAKDNPHFTVKHSDVGDGLYVFAVRVVTKNYRSSFHTSLDYTADPISGWYVWWMKNE